MMQTFKDKLHLPVTFVDDTETMMATLKVSYCAPAFLYPCPEVLNQPPCTSHLHPQYAKRSLVFPDFTLSQLSTCSAAPAPHMPHEHEPFDCARP